MKPFKVNRDSWHYKFNKNFFNTYGDNEWYMRGRWEPKHSNFCAYWRATFLRMIGFVFMSAFALMFLSLIVFAAWNNPIQAAQSFGAIIAVIVLAISFMAIKEKLSDKASDKPDSLFLTKYKSYKSKVCPSVEYDK